VLQKRTMAALSVIQKVPFLQAQSQSSEHVGFFGRNDNDRGIRRNGKRMAGKAMPRRR
jgi:hypothetical protein